MSIDYIGPDDMIFRKGEGGDEIHSGGFSVNSILMKTGMSPIMTMNNKVKTYEGKVSDLYEDLVVPNWVLSYKSFNFEPHSMGNNLRAKESENTEVIDDELYDNLLELVLEHNSKLRRAKNRATKRRLVNNDKQTTRRQK